jgi:tetratricopeptide (TPR) repeat protein
MIGFAHPLRLLWAIPLAGLVLVMLRLQLTALAWLAENVAARYLGQLTRSRPSTMRLHIAFLFVAGLLLLVASAGPYRIGPGEQVVETQTVVLIIDASLSMGAGDASPHPVTGDEIESRIDMAKILCQELIAVMPDSGFALLTFSGEAVIHSPPTRDHDALQVLLGALDYHIYSQNMGSRFSSAFAAVIHMMRAGTGRYQVVLLSDGELSMDDDYGDQLSILAGQGVPVHTVGIGSREWQKMSVYNLDDVINGVDEPRTAAEYQTRRERKELERMSGLTGGEALIVEYGDWVEELQAELLTAELDTVVSGSEQRIDLSRYPLAGFLLCFLIETIGLARRRPTMTAIKGSSATSLLVCLTCLVTGCGSPLLKSHLLNEKGIAHYNHEAHQQAASRFEQSAALKVREHVPVYNLANTYLARGDFTTAHELYEQAMRLQPKLAEAFYNDGHTLYRWGTAEIDPSGCQLDRTRTLWQQALNRFVKVTGLVGTTSTLGRAAEANRIHIEQALKELDRLAEECPQSDSGGGGGGGGGQEGGSEGGGGGSDGGDGAAPPPLSQEEQDQLAAALQRARANAAEASGYRQSRANQLTKESAEGVSGKKIWW